MRRPHYLKTNEGSETPRELFFFDTETHQDRVDDSTVEHRLWFGWALHVRLREGNRVDGRTWFRFTTPVELYEWLVERSRQKTRSYIFAHRLQFDARVCEIPQILTADGWSLRRFIIEDPPTLFVLRRDKVTFEFLDTRNWWAQALVKLGERVDLPKLEMPKKVASAEVWDTYCKRDVEVIERTVLAWIGFVKRHDLGTFSRTLAGQSFNAFRHKFMDHKIFIHSNEKSLALARSSYTAGRVECFRLGRWENRVHCYDVNSMYPWVMREQSFPREHVSYRVRPSIDELKSWCDEFGVCARVLLDTDIPAYPYRTPDKLLFPVGRFPVALAGPELKHALDSGHVVSAESAALYENAPLFEGYVDSIFRLRQEAKRRGDEVERYLLKIMMNSLYGKFGQAGHIWETVGESGSNDAATWLEADYETGAVTQRRRLCRNVQELFHNDESYHSLPSIAAYVTSYARLVLWGLVQRAGPSHVFYMDTDSLVVDDIGAERLDHLVDEERLGALKKEWTSAWFEAHGPKDYVCEHHRRTKGVRFGARWLDANTVQQEQWSSMKADLRAGELRLPRTKVVCKTLRRIYTKGTVLKSGFVEPLRLDIPS